MSDSVYVIARCAVRPGKAELAKQGAKELLRYCKENEPGLLTYEFYFNGTETELQVLETYKDNQAILNHNTDGHNDAFFEAVEITDISLWGAVTDELLAAWKDVNPTAYTHWDGFSR